MAQYVLFFRPCRRCHQPFWHCGSCAPGRRYCPGECSELATQDRARRARQAYRSTSWGREQHRDEEAERRERRRRERVGDRRPKEDQISVMESIEMPPAVEPDDALRPRKLSEIKWLLVVWPGLLAAAEELLGRHVACPFCGRRGLVLRAVRLHIWRRRGSGAPDGDDG